MNRHADVKVLYILHFLYSFNFLTSEGWKWEQFGLGDIFQNLAIHPYVKEAEMPCDHPVYF